MKKVLFVTYGGGHANMVVPVVKELMKRDFVQVDVLGLTTSRSAFEKQGIPCFSFKDLPIDQEAIAYGEALVENQQSHPLVSYRESVAYVGLSYQSLVRRGGAKEAEELYKAKGRQAFLPVDIMEKLIVDKSYDLVVATNSPRSEQAAIIAAGKLNVPSICMVDLFATQGIKWIGQKGYASKVCVLADAVKDMLVNGGRLPDEVVVTGNPAFDQLANLELDQLGRKLRQTKKWDEKKIILWCSQPEPEVHPFTGEKGNPELPMQIEKALKKACDEHQEWQLFVRPHPSENLEKREYLEGVEYGREEDLPSLLKAVDVVVVTSSTVGLEAALIGKSVVALNMSIFSPDMPFADMGIAHGVDQLEGLGSAIQEGINKKTFGVALPPVGRSTHSVCKVITDLLEVVDE